MAKIRLSQRSRVSWGYQDHHHPTWAPDGSSIVFVGGPTGREALFLFDVDRRTTRPLTASSANHRCPTFSPDGRFLYLARQTTPDEPWEIWVLDVDRPERQRRFLGAADRSYTQPTIAPDGKRVAFVAIQGGRPRILVGEIARDHIGNTRPLVEAGAVGEGHPAWCPDGQWIAFHQFEAPDGHTSQICRVRPDGRGFEVLTHGHDLSKHPAWAGDEYIVYQETDATGGRVLRLITSSAEPIATLTTSDTIDKHPAPSVSRDGTVTVALASRLPGDSSDPDHTFDIWLAPIEGLRAQVKRRRAR